jgi:hypothetical protein
MEDELLQSNWITKRRALRYIAAARLPHIGWRGCHRYRGGGGDSFRNLVFVNCLRRLEAAGSGERVIGVLGRKVSLRNVVCDLDRDHDTDEQGHKDDQ